MTAVNHPTGLITANAFRTWRADLRGELHEAPSKRNPSWLSRLLKRGK